MTELEKAVLRSALPTTIRFVALVMASYANADGTSIFPRVETLCSLTGLKRAAVMRSRAWLRRQRILVRTGFIAGRRGKISVYRLMAGRLPKPKSAKTVYHVDPICPKGSTLDRKGSTSDPEEVYDGDPYLSKYLGTDRTGDRRAQKSGKTGAAPPGKYRTVGDDDNGA
jgi:hypothetical protein